MKNIKLLLFVALILNFNLIITMETPSTLLPEELKAFESITIKIVSVNSSFSKLRQEDRDFFMQGLSYFDDQERISLIMKSVVSRFYEYASKNAIILEYDQKFITSIYLKMQNYIAARMFIFHFYLTPEEKSAISRENYLKNPQLALVTIKKHAKFFGQELVRIGVIPNTDKDKEKAAQDIIESKFAELKKAFEN